MLSGIGFAAAGANVVMQLARLPVGHGVARSTVESGRVDKHPIKRLRTTSAYLLIAFFGTHEERLAMRAEVNRAHTTVRSAPGDPVRYNAFDPALQLWVAACLYKGVEDLYRLFRGDSDTEQLENIYRYSRFLGTTLQVPEDRWPADRAAFDAYWSEGVARIEMDELTRTYLLGIAELSFLVAPLGAAGVPLRPLLRPVGRFMTAGFLPPEFRAALGLPWDERRSRRFDGVMRAAVTLTNLMPGPVRRFPWNAYLWDTRRRIRTGRPIV